MPRTGERKGRGRLHREQSLAFKLRGSALRMEEEFCNVEDGEWRTNGMFRRRDNVRIILDRG